MRLLLLLPLAFTGLAAVAPGKDNASSLDAAAYARLATAWDREAVEKRLGPSFTDLKQPSGDSRPRHYQHPPKPCELSFFNRTNPYELGAKGCRPDDDYWSESGQVIYVPDDPKNVGIDRIQVYAYYNHVFALSPRLDLASGKPSPDPQTQDGNYLAMVGASTLSQPIAMARNYGMLQNEALVIYRNGLLGVAGTQTSRADNERPYPGLLFPKNKVPTAIAVTAGTEFAVVTIWDTDTRRGQLAVIALEGKYLAFHTWPHIALPNQGSFSDLKLLGYVDLPMSMPTSVAAASNGWWNGPSQTDNKVLSQIDLADDGTRESVYKGDPGWSGIVANKGYAIVASKEENKVAVVDLTPLFKYVRESYLGSKENFERTMKTRGPKPADFPRTFDENKEVLPRVVWQDEVPKPTAVLAGLRIDRWSQDRYKAHVASEDGTIRVYDASSLMARFEWEKNEKWKELGSFQVGRNPVHMVFTRYGEHLEQLGKGSDGRPHSADPLNNMFYVACRGERAIIGAASRPDGKGFVFRRLDDQRLEDPVAVNVASRGYIVTAADFRGKKIVSFRIGPITDRTGFTYGAGEDGKAAFDLAGEMPVAGYPFLVTSANVN